MLPNNVVEYLQTHGVPFRRRPHARAVTSSELAQSLHVTGYRVVKSVVIDADGRLVLAVLPAADRLDLERLRAMLRADVELVPEAQFAPLFTGCEPGAEPPFGKLYGLPVVVDSSLLDCDRVIVRGGSHRESIELAVRDLIELESPQVGNFAVLPVWTEAARSREARA